MNENENLCGQTEENISLDAEIPEDDDTEEKFFAVSKENELLKKKLMCFEKGVKKEFIDDTVKLSENCGIDEVIKNHPDFISQPISNDTGVIASSETKSSDSALRKAFGLK